MFGPASYPPRSMTLLPRGPLAHLRSPARQRPTTWPLPPVNVPPRRTVAAAIRPSRIRRGLFGSLGLFGLRGPLGLRGLLAPLGFSALALACGPTTSTAPLGSGGASGDGVSSGGGASGGGTATGGAGLGGSPAGGSPGSGGHGTGGLGSGGAASGGETGVGGSGASATGGAGSGGEGAAPGSGGSSGDPCATAALCDGFEGDMDPTWTVQQDSVPMPAIDSSKGANGSSSSLKVSGTTQQSFLVAPVPAQSFYVRTYMNFSQGTGSISAHGWFIVGADNATSGAGAQMRLGASANHGHPETDFNVYGGGCNGEKTQFSDGASDGNQGWNNTTADVFNFTADTWYCVEAFFDGAGEEFRLWVDGQEKPGLHVTEATMCDAWSPTYTVVKIGAGANGNIGDIWYDDVVISTQPIGCE